MRGPLLIHASSYPTARSDLEQLFQDCDRTRLNTLDLQFGSILGICSIAGVKTYATKEEMLADSGQHLAGPDYFTEEAYRVGRANAWIIKYPKRFPKPIPNVKGALSIWEYDITGYVTRPVVSE